MGTKAGKRLWMTPFHVTLFFQKTRKFRFSGLVFKAVSFFFFFLWFKVMEAQKGNANNPPRAPPPQLVTQNVPKNYTPTPRTPFTTAREYKKLYTRRMKQISKNQEVQELQEVVDQNFWIFSLCFFFFSFRLGTRCIWDWFGNKSSSSLSCVCFLAHNTNTTWPNGIKFPDLIQPIQHTSNDQDSPRTSK